MAGLLMQPLSFVLSCFIYCILYTHIQKSGRVFPAHPSSGFCRLKIPLIRMKTCRAATAGRAASERPNIGMKYKKNV